MYKKTRSGKNMTYAYDDDITTKFAASYGERRSWMTIDLGEEKMISHVVYQYIPNFARVRTTDNAL